MCNHDQWTVIRGCLSNEDFPDKLRPIINIIDQHHNSSNESLSLDSLINLFFASYGNIKDKDYYSGIFEQLKQNSSSESSTLELISSLRRSRVLKQLAMTAYNVYEGREDLKTVFDLVEQLSDDKQVDLKDKYEFVTDDLEVLMNDTMIKSGLRWRLKTLNVMLGSLRKGDFGFLFARPETGKTTFLASEITYMASQLSEEDGPILWLNNEEQGKKVKMRMYQAALGCTTVELLRDLKGAQHHFNSITKCKIKLYDESIISRKVVESLCKELKPSLIVVDQIDKISGFAADRDDLVLGAIYQWARELAKTYCPVIGVCQADGTGEGQKWLTMAHVANAKTAKQAEADWILGIGKVNDPGYDNIRYFHLSKNKLIGDQDSDASLRHGRKEVLIEPDVARYTDLM